MTIDDTGARNTETVKARWVINNIISTGLIARGVGVAYIYSVIPTLFPGIFPVSSRGMGGLLHGRIHDSPPAPRRRRR